MTHGAVEAAGRFLHAVLWGEHVLVWEMLSPAGREVVLAAGERRGLDPLRAQRLRLGTSAVEERDEFLTGVVLGLRVDFSHVSLDDVRPVGTVVPRADGAVDVVLECPAAFSSEGWAAGTMVLSPTDGGRWSVDRIDPVVSGGA